MRVGSALLNRMGRQSYEGHTRADLRMVGEKWDANVKQAGAGLGT